MREPAPRWPCPVCLGVTLQKTPVPAADQLLLDHCPRCGGIWFEPGEVQLLRTQRPDALWARVPRRDDVSRVQCHACHAYTERDAVRCSSCGRRTNFDCPACQQRMEQACCRDLRLDVCKRCKGVWFDHHELSAIWQIEWHKALKKRRKLARRSSSDTDGSLLLDALTPGPDLLFYGARAAGDVAVVSAETLGQAPGMVGAAAEAVADAAAHVFEALAEIVAGIFSSF